MVQTATTSGSAYLLQPGDNVGDERETSRFTIEQPLGRGSFGQVYRAHDHLVDRLVALKFLLLGESSAEQSQAVYEAKVLTRIRHPNVVTVFDLLLHARTQNDDPLPPALVMEYIEGRELRGLLGEHPGGMDPAEVIALLRPVAAALVASHRAGVLHRDLKPSNIMVDNEGVVKVIDFGVAGQEPTTWTEGAGLSASLGGSGSDGGTTVLAGAAGTPYYVAPELWQGRPAGPQSDVFAFGVTAFFLLTGGRPVEASDLVDLPGANPQEQLQHRMTSGAALPGIRERRGELPPLLADVIDRCLAVDPERRFQKADELLQALDEVAQVGARILPDAPYVGLRAFGADDQGVFYGREEEVARLIGRLRRERVVSLVGESGAGKSSLALAGVAPRLQAGDLHDGVEWQVQRITPGADPLASLSRALADFRGDDGGGAEGPALTENPERWHELLGVRREGGRRRRRQAKPRGLLLVVDQLEELVTVCEAEEHRALFGRALAAAVDAELPIRILLTARADFLPRLGTVPGLSTALEAVHLVRPLDAAALRSAIVSPARAFGYEFETEAMVDAIVGEMRGRPGSLPLLQFGLAKLWEARDEAGKIIPERALSEIGGIGTALTGWADEFYEGLTRRGLAAETRRVLLDLLTPDGTKRSRSKKELVRAARSPAGALVVEELRDALLVVGDELSLELAHEALARSWELLRRLVEQTRVEREIASEAHRVAERWERRGRPRAMLWRGEDLVAARELRKGGSAHDIELLPLAAAFVDASLRAEVRGRWGLRIGVGIVVTIIAVFVIAIIVQQHQAAQALSASAKRAQRERDQKERQRRRAEDALKHATDQEKVAQAAKRTAERYAQDLKRINRQLADEKRILGEQKQKLLEEKRTLEGKRKELEKLIEHLKNEVMRLTQMLPR